MVVAAAMVVMAVFGLRWRGKGENGSESRNERGKTKASEKGRFHGKEVLGSSWCND
jgi:hypothetical protein